jgi:hypothetical protein
MKNNPTLVPIGATGFNVDDDGKGKNLHGGRVPRTVVSVVNGIERERWRVVLSCNHMIRLYGQSPRPEVGATFGCWQCARAAANQ